MIVLDKPQEIKDHVFKEPVKITNNRVKLTNCMSVGIRGKRWPSIAVEIACNNYTLIGHKCEDVQIGIIADGVDNVIINCDVVGYTEDAIRFCKNWAYIAECYIEGYKGKKKAHVDAIQFYSGDQTSRYSHKERYLVKHVLSHCTIRDNVIIDNSKYVQGIFCSDGLLSDIVVENNYVSLPNSPHSISIRGMHGLPSLVRNNFIIGAEMQILPVRRASKAKLKELGPINVMIEENDGL